MEQPATTNSTSTRRTRASTAELLDQMRGELVIARMALDSERGAVRALQRDRAAEVKAVREEEARKYRDSLGDLKSRLERDHEDALQRQKDAVTKTLNAGVLRALKEKDAETRQELAEVHAREEALKVQVRDAVRTSLDAGPTSHQQIGASSGDIQKLKQEVTALRLHNKQLEERLQVVVDADRQKASDLRSQHEEHEMQLVQLKKSSQQATHRLLEELKSKERTISQLERQLILQTGRVERLLERQHEECECSEDNCTRGRVRLVKRLAELQASMKKAVETHAQEKKEMIRKLRELEGKSQSNRLSQKNSKRNNRPATREMQVALDNIESGKEPEEDHQTELEKLRDDIEERDRIIAELRQAAREKDLKLDHPTNRHRKEQMRQYYRQFMELETVAELEEDSGAGEDSPSSSGSPSLSPQPYIGDMWSELPNKEYHDTLYSCLLKEHLELQREYQFLQTRLKRELAEPNRIRLKLEHELARARTHVRELKKALSEQKGGGAVLTEKIAALQTEAHDLREQNELLEFRILELEECHENSSDKSQGPGTRDVWTDTESDDVSDSGVHSLPTSEDTSSSDVDIGIHDIKMEIRNEELKARLLEIAKTSCNTADRCCLQQVLALLESYETRVEDDGSCSTVTPDSPSARSNLDTGGRAPRNLSESATATINDSSKFTSRIIATVLPFTDQSSDRSDASTEGEELKKRLKNAECLQESGIFEEAEYNSQGTQTECVTAEQPLKSPFETCVVGILSAEIQKLTQFRERVEEAGNGSGNKKLLRVDEGRGDESPSPHRKELEYCRERLQLLEDKVRVYESSGELQARLLADRLQKEVRLTAQVKELSAKVEKLVAENRCLEEEKCEFEEAENDTRLKCQKLEVKLVSLSEKKSDLQAQLQQERRNMSRMRSTLSESERKKQEARGQLNYLEVMLNKYEQRNYELEEREVDLKHRLEMLENSMPALLMWNMWRLVQDTGISRADVTAAVSNTLVRSSGGERRGRPRPTGRQKGRPSTSPELSARVCPPCSAREDPSRLREIEEDRQRILTERREAEKNWQATEEQLRSRLQVLEAQAGPMNSEIQGYKEAEDKYKKRIRELENELYGTKSGSQESGVPKAFDSASEKKPETERTDVPPSEKKTEAEKCQNLLTDVPSVKCEEMDCMRKLQELVQSEIDMKKRVSELERKEKAYMQTLQQADELWSDMENSYKKRISTAEDSEASMRDKVKKLEESETKLRQAYHHDDQNEMLLEKLQNMETSEKTFVEKIRILEAEKNQLVEETTQLREALQSVQTELNKTKEMVAGPMKEELQKERKMSKILKDEISTIEQDMLDKSSSQQAQINGLKVQLSKTSRDLVDLECTNGELKEEVDTLEAKVSELKTVIEQQKQHEEKLMIQMSQTILEKEQELDETKREMRYSQIPNAREELNQVDKSVLQDIGEDALIVASAALLELPEVQTSKAAGEPMETPEAKGESPEINGLKVQLSKTSRDLVDLECTNGELKEEVDTLEAPEKPKEVTQRPSEAVPTKPCGCKCTCGAEQPPPVSYPSQKPVLRRWLLPQKLNPKKDWGHWRQC